MHLWRVTISERLVVVLRSFVGAARGGVFMSKTVDPRIAEDAFGLLNSVCRGVSTGDRDFWVFALSRRTSFDPILTYMTFHLAKKVD